jgi:glycosyltransferase involved in cell wall biosynthesis
LRILIDYRPALTRRTGVGEYVHELAAAYAAAQARQPAGDRDRLTLFSSSWKDRLEAGRIAGAATLDRRVPVRLLNLLWHRLDWPPVEALARDRFDVVHSASPLLIPSRSAARVVTIHDLDFLDHPERTRAEIRRDYPALAARHAQRADQIIVSSRFTAGEVARRLNVPADRVALVPPGAPRWVPRSRTDGAGYLLFFGTLEPRKNVGTLLEAYGRLLGRLPSAPDLVLAGAAPPSAAGWLAALARTPLAGRARHVGYVAPERREAVYHGALALVMPSFTEGFGFPVLEAMTAGVPVVAANRGSLPELVGDAAILFDPADPDALASALERVVCDAAWAREATRRGLDRASRYRWETAADALAAVYRRALDIHQGRAHE